MDNSGIIRKVNGKSYQFFKLPVKKSIRILIRLAKIIGVSVGKALSTEDIKKEINKKKTAQKKGGLLETDIDIGGFIDGLTGRLDEDEVIEIIEEILQFIHQHVKNQDYKKIDLEIDFQDNLGDLVGVIKEALLINYSDFFGAAFGLVKGPEAE